MKNFDFKYSFQSKIMCFTLKLITDFLKNIFQNLRAFFNERLSINTRYVKLLPNLKLESISFKSYSQFLILINLKIHWRKNNKHNRQFYFLKEWHYFIVNHLEYLCVENNNAFSVRNLDLMHLITFTLSIIDLTIFISYFDACISEHP